jgi:hypothetical protein
MYSGKIAVPPGDGGLRDNQELNSFLRCRQELIDFRNNVNGESTQIAIKNSK